MGIGILHIPGWLKSKLNWWKGRLPTNTWLMIIGVLLLWYCIGAEKIALSFGGGVRMMKPSGVGGDWPDFYNE